ncbi:MAG: hypothetical protein ACUZ9M_04485 [Candidatus Scalindua sp.]
MTNYEHVIEEISRTRDVFDKLNDFFHNADQNIANDPDDPRDGIGRFSGLDRLMFLIPCVISRLEEDVSKSKEVEGRMLITEGLQAVKEGLNSVTIYYLQDDVNGALILLSNSLSEIDKISSKKFLSSIRFFHDLFRIAPEFHILLDMFESFRENKKRRPTEPEGDESWSPERWLHYYREQARLEEPLIAMVDAEGLSGTSLEKGMKQTIEESEQRDKMVEKHFISYNLMRNRDAAFDPEHPERFLDLSEIPDIKDEDGDYEVRTVGLRYEEEEEEEPSEPWASSLPELQNWNESISESSSDDSELHRHDFEDDPVYRLLEPFTHNLIECLKRNHLRRVNESEREEDQMRSPLENYLVILPLKAQVRLSSCGVLVESIGHEAPRKGVYLFTMECLERIADAIEKISQEHLYHLAAEARNIKKQIECLGL